MTTSPGFEFTMGYFYDELRKKVSANNAKLLLHTAAVKTGMPPKMDAPLRKEDAQAICMELIRAGGPGFQVGRAIYSQMLS
jgi:hypothetical protein